MHSIFTLLETGIVRGSLPFCYFALSAKRPLNWAYPKEPVTLGDHIRKRRLDLGLFQKDVAVAIGVDTCTITNWEKGHSEPELRFVPRIIAFLNYEPDGPEPVTLGERIKRYRYLGGITQEQVAKQIGIDPGTLSRLERSRGRCFPSVLTKVAAFLDVLNGSERVSVVQAAKGKRPRSYEEPRP
jgi:transcriptional regulator with XRE-family HTH domain